FSFGGDSQLDLIAAVTEAAGTRSLLLGVRVNAVPGGGSPALRVEGEGWLAAIALTGDSPAVVLPSAALAVRAPGSASAPRVVDTSQIKVRSLRAGVVWAVSQLRPVIELLDVDFGGKHYDRIDLTDADSVVALASATVLPLILSALGAGAGRPLAALAGLVPPSRDPGSPLAVDPGLFVSQPTRAIGAFHRSVLLDATHNWSSLLGEVADLLGTGGAIAGSGTVEDPWRSPLGPAAPLAVELAAWNAGTGPDPQRLRLGLRAASTLPPFQFSWLAELLAFDLPDSAAGAVSLMAGHHMVFRMQPVFSTEVLPKRVLAAE